MAAKRRGAHIVFHPHLHEAEPADYAPSSFADSANTKGTVKISSDKPIFAISRTYNQAASGTFGQFYPSLVASQSVTSGQTARRATSVRASRTSARLT